MIGSHFFQWRAQDTLAEVQDELHVIQRLRDSYRHLFDLQHRRLDPQGNFDVLVKIAHGVPVIATDRRSDLTTSVQLTFWPKNLRLRLRGDTK